MKNTKNVTVEELAEKVQELITKHNRLAETVADVADALNVINQELFAQGSVPDPGKYDA